jgi:hypothetical protein
LSGTECESCSVRARSSAWARNSTCSGSLAPCV